MSDEIPEIETLVLSDNLGQKKGIIKIGEIRDLINQNYEELSTTINNLQTTVGSFDNIVTLDGTQTITGTKTFTTTIAGSISGNAATATQLATSRTFRTNLASTSTASFNGTANVTPGVTGTLPLTNGGTGATTAANALTNLGAVAISGSRGALAGYETVNSTSSALTVDASTQDGCLVTGAVTITVSNGDSGYVWTKTIGISNASASVSLGGSWNWMGGSAPTITANGVLVVHWCSTFGIANFVSPS